MRLQAGYRLATYGCRRAKRAEASLQTARNLLPFLRRQFEEGQRQVGGPREAEEAAAVSALYYSGSAAPLSIALPYT